MSGGPGIWGWTDDIGRLGFTITLSLGLSPDDVLQRYGVAPGGVELLTRDESWGRLPIGNGAQLRAGTLGRWAFCFEERGAVGIRTSTLRRLSADTETIAFLVTAGTGSFVYIKDGEGVEAFQPGVPETLRGSAPHTFWAATQKIMEAMARTGPVVPAHAVLQAIAKHVRGALDRQALEGPLLTGFLPDDTGAPAGPDPADPATARPGAAAGAGHPGSGHPGSRHPGSAHPGAQPGGVPPGYAPAGPPPAREAPPGSYPIASPTPPWGGEVRQEVRPNWPTQPGWNAPTRG